MLTYEAIAPGKRVLTEQDPPFLRDNEPAMQGFYEAIGFNPPWIGYLFRNENGWVGTGAFKGAPVNQQIEIAYAVAPEYEGQGFGTDICRILTEIARNQDASLRIIARTLPEENASTSILKKNGFHFAGVVEDPEDGEVWEWEF